MCGAAHVPGAELCAHVFLLNLFTSVSVSTLHVGQGVQGQVLRWPRAAEPTWPSGAPWDPAHLLGLETACTPVCWKDCCSLGHGATI